jgi:hypothetical protein
MPAHIAQYFRCSPRVDSIFQYSVSGSNSIVIFIYALAIHSGDLSMFTGLGDTLLQLLKLAPRYLIALGLMAGFMLFANEALLQRLGVLEFAQHYRPMLGLALVVTGALFLMAVLVGVLEAIRRAWRKRQFNRRQTKRLNRLTEDEKQILRFYIAKQTRANSLRIDDGVVQALVAEGIIYRSASMGNVFEGFAYNISDTAWEYLNVNPGLLAGTTHIARTDRQSDF